jgi:hypothetical protein
MDYTKLTGCHPDGDPVGLKGSDGINTFSSYQAGRDDMKTIIRDKIERMHQEAVLAAIGNETDWLRSRIGTLVDVLDIIEKTKEV